MQFSWCHSNPLHAYPEVNSGLSRYVHAQSPKPSLSHLSESHTPLHYKEIDTSSYTGAADYIDSLRASKIYPASKEFGDSVISYLTSNPQDRHFSSSITQPFNAQDSLSDNFGSVVGPLVSETPLPVQTEVINRPNFVLQPLVETIQKPNFVVQENVIGVQKPEYLIQEVQEILTKPEYLVQEKVVGTITKPTFEVQDQIIGVVKKPEFDIQEDVEFVVKPDFKVQDVTEVVTKPTYTVEENTVVVQKPTFAIQSLQEVIQKPNIIIIAVPQTILKPEYQITDNIIPVAKPTFFVQETQETVVKPEFVVTEEVVPVPRPNFLVQEEVQVVQKPNFLIQDVVETVQRPEYNVQETTVTVQKPDFSIEEVTETVVKPSFVEQEVPIAVVNPHFIVEEQVVPVTKPHFVVQETLVPVVKPEFKIQDVTEVIKKPEYIVEDVSITVDKPTYFIEDTPVIVKKPNYIIEENVETITKPEYVIQDEVEIITKPQYIVQEQVVETIVKPKFVVVSASNPRGEEFDITKYKLKSPSLVNSPVKIEAVKQPFVLPNNVNAGFKIETVEQSSLKEYPTNSKGNLNQVPFVISEVHKAPQLLVHSQPSFSPLPHHQTQSIAIQPAIKPKTIDVIEEFSHPDHIQVPHHVTGSQNNHPFSLDLGHLASVEKPVYLESSGTTSHATIQPIQHPHIHSHHHHHSETLVPIPKSPSSLTSQIQTQEQNLEQKRLYSASHPSTESSLKSDYRKAGHGLFELGKHLNHQKTSGSSNEFLAPHIKIKKDISKSEEEELKNLLLEVHGLLENKQISTGFRDTYGYLFENQHENDSKPNDQIIFSSGKIYDDSREETFDNASLEYY